MKYEEAEERQMRTIWIMTHIRNDEASIDSAFERANLCSNNNLIMFRKITPIFLMVY